MIEGYFTRNRGELRMPVRAAGERDEVGIRWLGGEAPKVAEPVKEGEERYECVEDYDAVLRESCRLE